MNLHPRWTISQAGCSLPENSDCLAFSKTALCASAITNDLYTLLNYYCEKDSLQFTPFRNLWRSRQFSLIHFACYDEQSRDVFVTGLYQVLLSYLSSEKTLSAQAGAVFGLYLVYATQPTSLKKVPIRLTMSVWHTVQTVYKQAFEQKATDLIFVIRKLQSNNSFVYIAQQEDVKRPFMASNEFVADQLEKRLIQTESAMLSNVLVPIDPLLNEMSSLAAEYRKAKAGLVSLALARRSSEIVMGQLLKSKPAGMNVKEAKPIPHFIGNLSVPTEAPQPVASTAAGASTVPTTMHSDGNSDSNIEIDDQSALITVLAASSKPILAASSKTALAASSKTSESFGSIEEASTADSSMTSLVTETVVRAGEKTGAHTMSAVAGPSNDSMQGHAPRFIRRAGGKGTELSLPSAFPLSMLQSTAFSISGQTEDVLRDYYKHRHLRYEYTGSGGLTMNNNEFPENFLLVNRAHKRELEKKRQVEEKRQRKSEKSKRRHTELTRKLQDRKSDANSVREEEEEEGEVDGGNASARFEQEQYGQEGSDSRSQDQGQPGKDHTMEEVIGEAQDQHMLEATDGEESQSADAGERGDPHHQGHVVRSMMGEEHADGSAILAGVDPQAIEGAESLLGLLKQGL